MPKARVEFPPEFRSAASLTVAPVCGVCLAFRPSDDAQAFEITSILGGYLPSDGRFSAIVELASSPSDTAKVAEKDTQAFENMGSSTKWRPQKVGFLAQERPRTSPNLALLARKGYWRPLAEVTAGSATRTLSALSGNRLTSIPPKRSALKKAQ